MGINPEMYRPICPECVEKHEQEHAKKVEEYIKLKNYFKVERAKKRIYGKVPLTLWEPAIEVVEEYIKENPEKFDSTEEIIVTTMLIANEIVARPQAKVGNMRVDIMMPEDKIVVEVDGFTHEHSKEKDSRRDGRIREILGNEWEVVRIPTDFANKHPDRLIDGIFYIHKAQSELRKQTGGAIQISSSKILAHMLKELSHE